MKFLEQDFKKTFENKNEIIFDDAKLVEEQPTILRNHFERNLISELEKCKCEAVKDLIQLLYNKGLFDIFEIKDQIFNEFVTSTNQYLLEKYRTEIKNIRGCVFLAYSTIGLSLFNKTNRVE